MNDMIYETHVKVRGRTLQAVGTVVQGEEGGCLWLIARHGIGGRDLRGDGESGRDLGEKGEQRLSLALTKSLELDAFQGKRFVMGEEVRFKIPTARSSDGLALSTLSSMDDYWKARMSVGELLRPLLLDGRERDRLYRFQRRGVDWLKETAAGILADDMGLGKTAQAVIALGELLREGEIWQALVVSPLSLVGNWADEVGKWMPHLGCLRMTPQRAIRGAAWAAVRERVHVLITNYEHLRDPPEAMLEATWDLVVLDEAHKIRNIEAEVSMGVRLLPRNRIWALTGTPIERDEADLLTILATLAPERFAERDAELPGDTIRARARAFVLRRRKEDVLKDLPPLVEQEERLDLSERQQRVYNQLVDNARGKGEGEKSALRLLTRLRQVCDADPTTGESTKLDRIVEILEAIEANGEKAIVFSNYLRPLKLLGSRMERAGIEYEVLMGDMSVDARERVVKSFQRDDKVALLASVRVTSEGLTLTAANHVVFVNEAWNPSANQQARDRVRRIGQERPVTVYRFRARGTIEEHLERILERKERTYEEIVEGLVEGRWGSA